MTPSEPPSSTPTRSSDPNGERADDRALTDRLDRVEGTLAALAAQVCTRRLVVTGDDATAAIVMEVVDGQAQVRLSVGRPPPPRPATAPGGFPPLTTAPTTSGAPTRGERRTTPDHVSLDWSPAVTVVLFASPAQHDLGALAGLQVWSDGDVVAALEAWHDGVGPWRASVSLGEGPDDQPSTGP